MFNIPHKERPEIPNEIKNKYGFTRNLTFNDWGQVFNKGTRGMAWYYDGFLKEPEILKQWIDYLKLWSPANDTYFKFFKKFGINILKKTCYQYLQVMQYLMVHGQRLELIDLHTCNRAFGI